jgi:hypothetical protein
MQDLSYSFRFGAILSNKLIQRPDGFINMIFEPVNCLWDVGISAFHYEVVSLSQSSLRELGMQTRLFDRIFIGFQLSLFKHNLHRVCRIAR